MNNLRIGRLVNISQLLSLLQLVSPALPIGAFSYSEGLEALVQLGKVATAEALETWLAMELRYGSIRMDGAVLVRVYKALQQEDFGKVRQWNAWLSALRETEELRQQQWQMGRALMRLLQDVSFPLHDGQNAAKEQGSKQLAVIGDLAHGCGIDCNMAVAMAIAAYTWQIDLEPALLGYLHSWASNLVSAGVRLIPLGQTAGQQLLLNLQAHLFVASNAITALADEDLYSCSWGLSLASMNHEVQYSRLFRS